MNREIFSIGGIGGSGTRVIAHILNDIGYFIGDDLNKSNDTLLFTLLFKRENILTLSDAEFQYFWNIFVKIMATDKKLTIKEREDINKLTYTSRTLHNKVWLTERLKYIDNNKEKIFWGWKEPNTHIVIERLLKVQKNLKFIYVYRNGLDMAYSSNQNQLKLWGDIFFNQKNIDINPRNSLKYWCIAHKRMIKLKKSYEDKIMLLNFDDLCSKPAEILTELFKFLNTDINDLNHFIKMIKPPLSMGQYKKYSLNNFNNDDIKYIKSIGFLPE